MSKPICITRLSCPVFTPEQANPQCNWIPVDAVESDPLEHYDVILIKTKGPKDKRMAEAVRALVELYTKKIDPDELDLEGEE